MTNFVRLVSAFRRRWQALRRVLQLADFELDFLVLFGSEFELF